MSRRIRRVAVPIGLAWIAAGAAQAVGGALGLIDVPLMLVSDTLILAATGTLGILIDRRDKAQQQRTEDVIDAVTMNAAPADAAYSIAFEQGKRFGRQERDQQLAAGDEGAEVIQFPPATYAAPERSRATADETTVPLSPTVTSLVPGQPRHRPAPHPRRRR